MHLKHKCLLIPILLLILPCSAHAYWPTSVDENFLVAADPDTFEWYSRAIPYPDGSILVVYKNSVPGAGCAAECYQIIDRYGELKYEEPHVVIPDNPSGGYTLLIADSEGGAFVAYAAYHNLPTQGIYAQRLDSLGNRLWGDSGVRIFPIWESDFDIALDGTGGFLLAVAPYLSDLYAQRIDGDGNLLWGEQGVWVPMGNPYGVMDPIITHDGRGGAFVLWKDHRFPFGTYGALFYQHLDEDGNRMWVEDLHVYPGPWYHQMISDGEGGCIIEGVGGTYSTHYRIGPDGTVLWTRDHLSWWANYDNKMLEGEPGFFYLGFFWDGHFWGQRMDIDGNNYWPTWPGELGAAFNVNSHGWFYSVGGVANRPNYFFRYPYHYAIYVLAPETQPNQKYLFISYLDLEGNRMLGDEGVLLMHTESRLYAFSYNNAVPIDDGGAVGVSSVGSGNVLVGSDVCAKRANPDGSLGGPLHLLVDLTPHNTPIRIPAAGGSFTYDIAIADTYCVASVFDAWIEAVLPGGDTMEILLREELSIDSNSTITRFDLGQFVPGGAPAGEYTYKASVGFHPDFPWAEDSFTFEKLAGVDPGNMSLTDWRLLGFFDGYESITSTSHPAQIDLLSIYPNPFNPVTVLSYKLPVASFVKLSVYDVTGRRVTELVNGFRDAGNHEVTFDASNLSSGIYIYRLSAGEFTASGKMVLMK